MAVKRQCLCGFVNEECQDNYKQALFQREDKELESVTKVVTLNVWRKTSVKQWEVVSQAAYMLGSWEEKGRQHKIKW